MRIVTHIGNHNLTSSRLEITESGDHVGFQITSEEIDTVRAIHSLFSEGNN
jgi:hypothetical protein